MFQKNIIKDEDKTLLWQRKAFEINHLLKEFPAKTNILVVDSNSMFLLDMKHIMKKYNYQVTIYSDAEEALSFLKNCKNEINLVLWDFHMPVINGLQALKIIGSDMDLPVVIISDDNQTDSVMQATLHGACDYVMKPVREETIAIIWKHIVKKIVKSKPGLTPSVQSNPVQCSGLQDDLNINKKQEKQPQIQPDPVQTSGLQDNLNMNRPLIQSDPVQTSGLEAKDSHNINKKQEKQPQIQSDPVQTSGLQAKDSHNINKKEEKKPEIQSEDPVQTIGIDQDMNEQKMDKREEKKPRVMWTYDLQQKFLKAIDLVGGAEKANPKILLKCMQDMKVEGLTRHNVSSHLQKHRLCLEEARISQERREFGRSTGYNRPPSLLNQTTIPSYLMKDGDMIMSNLQFQHNQYSNVYSILNNNHQFITPSPQAPFPYFDHHHHHHLHHQPSASSIPHPHLPYIDHHHHHLHQLQSPFPLASMTATSHHHQHQEQTQQSKFQLSDNVMIKNEPENDFGIDAMNTELIYPANLPYDPKEFLADGFNFSQ